MTKNLPSRPKVAIVDYGLGNLFSIRLACERAGLEAVVTSLKKEILGSDAVILPGVGAFGDAMATLRRMDLVSVLRDAVASDKPFMGICLGLQLLMSESYEFGFHKGLGIIEGQVIRFENLTEAGRILKVPQVQWNRIYQRNWGSKGTSWTGSLLDGLNNGEFMYFIHSFFVHPDDSSVVLSVSTYGHVDFCSSLCRRNIFAFQFHPERSSQAGFQIYRNLARFVYLKQAGGGE